MSNQNASHDNPSFFGTLKTIAKRLASGYKTNTSSLVDITKPHRIEPIIIISSNLQNNEMLKPMITVLNSFFISTFIHAARILGSEVKEFKASKIIGSLSPSSSGKRLIDYVATEDHPVFNPSAYKNRLPKVGSTKLNYSLESDTPLVEAGLVQGSVVDVKIVDKNNNPHSMILNFRSIPSFVKSKAIINFVGGRSTDTSFMARINLLRVGKISFWRDFVLARDLIAVDARTRYENDEVALNTIVKRQKSGVLNTLLTGNVNLGTCANFFIITEQEAKEIEAATGQLFETKGTLLVNRDTYFENTAAMGFAIIDTDFDTARIFIKGVDAPSEVTLSQLNRGSKDSTTDIIKAILPYLGTSSNPLSGF